MTTAERTMPRSNAECMNTFMSGVSLDATTSLPERVSARTLDIANRLRFICAHMEADDLLALAARMAVVELKYEGGRSEHRAKPPRTSAVS